mgnify:FL=1
MTSLPPRVQIGPLTFQVTDDRDAHNQGVVEDLLDTYGRIRDSKGLIILDPNQTDAHKRITLLHEVMHGCWHLGDRSHKNDEKAIRSLCAPLLDVLRRNPDLVAYLLATEDAE